jgi:hypothetical protein
VKEAAEQAEALLQQNETASPMNLSVLAMKAPHAPPDSSLTTCLFEFRG